MFGLTQFICLSNYLVANFRGLVLGSIGQGGGTEWIPMHEDVKPYASDLTLNVVQIPEFPDRKAAAIGAFWRRRYFEL